MKNLLPNKVNIKDKYKKNQKAKVRK